MNLLTRRRFLQDAAVLGVGLGLEQLVPAYAWQSQPSAPRAGDLTDPAVIDLRIQNKPLTIDGRRAVATTINGSIPGPLVRLREGQTAILRVTNELQEVSALHWHGLLVPAGMDGVPGVSFAGIHPGQTFTYRYQVRQSGTYWYHSHSGLQEQAGVYAPLIIDPVEPEPFSYERDYIVLLSDWTFEDPRRVLAKLKKHSAYYNFQRQTGLNFLRESAQKGWRAPLANRLMWGRMRMDPTDIADVTGYTYTYLMNGLPPSANWTALFQPGERVRLRFINSAAMTYFDVRIPGLALQVIQADGQNVKPVTVDEFRIAPAETYDALVEPRDNHAYTIFAETMDRSGYACGLLAPRRGMTAALPARRSRPLRTMADMGHHGAQSRAHTYRKQIGSAHLPHTTHAHHVGRAHGPDHHGPGAAMVARVPRSRLSEPGIGLEKTGHRVLTYSDLHSLTSGTERLPGRELELHLTGNMERYMWSFNGKTFAEVTRPIPLDYGERVRLTLVNDTMMDHPIHLHGMWMELENGAGLYKPKKHTLSVKPAERMSVDITVDAPGLWAFHCHLLYHMEAGMFRLVSVSPAPVGAEG